MTVNDVRLTDRDGDTLRVTELPGGVLVARCYQGDGIAAVALNRETATELADFLVAWLEQDAPETEHPDSTRDGYDWPAAAGSILHDAHAAVYGDREADYGHPREDFTRQAIIWTGLLHHKLADGAHLEPEDIARCMVGTKLARDVHSPKRDNRVDGAGYFLTLDRLATGR